MTVGRAVPPRWGLGRWRPRSKQVLSEDPNKLPFVSSLTLAFNFHSEIMQTSKIVTTIVWGHQMQASCRITVQNRPQTVDTSTLISARMLPIFPQMSFLWSESQSRTPCCASLRRGQFLTVRSSSVLGGLQSAGWNSLERLSAGVLLGLPHE